MGGACRKREVRNSYKILVGKPEGRRRVERSRHEWEYNSKIDHTKRREIVDPMHMTQTCASDQWRALVNAILKLPLP
jgi:hypothetical protein